MSEHRSHVRWNRGGHEFTYEAYSRDHTWGFEGGSEVAASAAPKFGGNTELVDPEEAFVAALSSCHMLTFLAIAARKRLVVENYDDEAMGVMEKNEDGRLAVTRVVLRPRIEWGGDKTPTSEQIDHIHHLAHEQCFIANSVRTNVSIEAAD
jgi:organic hydroperoxide reductase OsmC/OhrA